MCPNEAARKEWTGLDGSLIKICLVIGRNAEAFCFQLHHGHQNQIHLVTIPLAGALPIVVILQGASMHVTSHNL